MDFTQEKIEHCVSLVRTYLKGPNTKEVVDGLLHDLGGLPVLFALADVQLTRRPFEDIKTTILRVFRFNYICKQVFEDSNLLVIFEKSLKHTSGEIRVLAATLMELISQNTCQDFLALERLLPEQSFYPALVALLNDQELSVAQRIGNTFVNLAKIQDQELSENVLQGSALIEALVEFTSEKNDDTKRCRSIETVIRISNEDQNIFNRYLEVGLIEAPIKLYMGDDLLLKLVAIDFMEQYGDSRWSADYLFTSVHFKNLVQELGNPMTFPEVKSKLMLLIAKLHSHFPEPIKPYINADYLTTILEFLHDQPTRLVAIDIVGFLGSSNEGIKDLVKNHQLTKGILNLIHSSQDGVKAAILSILGKIFVGNAPAVSKLTGKNSGILQEPEVMQALKIVFYNLSDVSKYPSADSPSASLELLTKLLDNPFDDIRENCLILFRALSRFLLFVKSLMLNSDFIVFLLKRDANFSKTTMEMKYNIIENALECQDLEPFLSETVERDFKTYVSEGPFALPGGKISQVADEFL